MPKMLGMNSGRITEQNGWQFLGSTKLASAATTTASVSFPACDMLIIEYIVTGYSALGIASFRFNGDAAGTSLYSWRFVTLSSAATPVLASATSVAAAGLIQTGPTAPANAVQRCGRLRINNFAGVHHPMVIEGMSTTGTALATPTLQVGAGDYSPAGGTQITSAVMVSTLGNLNAGSGFAVFGMTN